MLRTGPSIRYLADCPPPHPYQMMGLNSTREGAAQHHIGWPRLDHRFLQNLSDLKIVFLNYSDIIRMAIAKLLYDTSSNWLCNAELVLLSTILSRTRCTGYLYWCEGIASHSEPTRLHAKLSITEIDNWSQWLLRGCLFAPSDCRNQGRLQESRSTNVSLMILYFFACK